MKAHMKPSELNFQTNYRHLGLPESIVPSLTFVIHALHNGLVVANADITHFPTCDRVATLNHLHVVPHLRHQRLGIGSTIYDMVESFALTQRASQIAVWYALNCLDIFPEIELEHKHNFFAHRGYVISPDVDFSKSICPAYIRC